MKKAALFFVFCALALSASAQFKVQSNGKISVQTTSTPLSPISINTAGSSSYYIACNSGGMNGLSLTTQGNNSGTIYGGYFHTTYASTAVGMRGDGDNATTSIGVMGCASMGSKTIGLLGSTNCNYTNLGAGVYGTMYGDMGSQMYTNGVYAGFFYGNVKVTGSIIGGSTIQGTFLGEAAGESGTTGGLSLRSASVAGSLSGLSVTTYQKERPEKPKDVVYIDDPDSLNPQDRVEPEPDIMDEQFYEKTHYALDADRLEETFPDLVYTNKDGSKAINYVEMIPLLVQSINELSAKIEVLEGQAQEESARKARSTTSIQGSAISQNRLYQNTPNPFKEQTVIRFSLADDVRDAAICIFDMTGKTIRKLPVSSGMESVSVGGYELGEGMFLYSLIVNGQEIDTKRIIVFK